MAMENGKGTTVLDETSGITPASLTEIDIDAIEEQESSSNTTTTKIPFRRLSAPQPTFEHDDKSWRELRSYASSRMVNKTINLSIADDTESPPVESRREEEEGKNEDEDNESTNYNELMTHDGAHQGPEQLAVANAVTETEIATAVPEGYCFTHRIRVVLGLVVLALVGGVVGITVAVTGGGESSSSDGVIVVTTASPTLAPTLSELRTVLEEEFGPIEPRTPQEDALEWLLDSNPPQEAQPNDPFLTLKERYIVAVLYFSTNGEQWTSNLGFLNGSSVCSWNTGVSEFAARGVYCDDAGIMVNEIVLDDNLLVGPIPSEIGGLRSLVELDLRNNLLTGTLPTELGLNTMLDAMYLDFNRIVGPIPSEFGYLGNLKQFQMSFNRLTGTPPTELGLTGLIGLQLSLNVLTGPIPSELGDLRESTQLSMSTNRLTGTLPTEVGLNTLLRTLFLSSNELSGPIPSEIGNLQRLTLLGIYWNQFTGSIPSEIGKLRNLPDLWLVSDLTGSIPSEIGNLRSLKALNLGGNNLSSSIPSEIGNLGLLEELFLDSNDFTGTVPTEIAATFNLESLYLEGNDFSGSLDPFFCERTNPIEDFRADCLGSPPEIRCSCCTRCCINGDDCVDA